ncbi:Aminopeptidase N [Penaeus vannamei]|uniref:Aminopeptidase N n=1 Tax=Penaeus vannamei TaxID=6689 RepID=A0A3R7PEX3_PENVA|nr:Aminopeptidase N [Penaeus vannamei]
MVLSCDPFPTTHARRAFPCFDEPALKATFEVHLARETWMTSLSKHASPRRDLCECQEGQEGWVWDRFERSVPMSTYLVAFVVSDFSYPLHQWQRHSLSNTIRITRAHALSNPFLSTVWAQPSAIRHAEYVSEVGSKILAFYESYFNVSYPLPKMDMVAVPDIAVRGMENWETGQFLYDPDVDSANHKDTLLEVVAHELAHQWFGNLVTPAGGRPVAQRGIRDFRGLHREAHMQSHLEENGKIHHRETPQSLRDRQPRDLPSDQRRGWRSHPAEISEIFDRIEYNKGASIVRMMTYFLGESTFRRGLNSYLNTFAYTNAEQDDLWEHLTAAAHRDRKLPRA